MSGKLLFTTYQGRQAAMLIQENRLKAVQLFPQKKSKIGAIYICKVKNVVRNLDAFFVEIGGEEREICFLSKRDSAHPFLLNRPFDGRILEGDEFPVQIVRDAQKTKQASVTTQISLTNDYFVLSVGDRRIGYSNKFSSEEKKYLKHLVQGSEYEVPQPALPHGFRTGESSCLPVGLVVRTRAAEPLRSMETLELAENLLFKSFQELVSQWNALFHAALHHTCFSCLLEAPAPWEAALEQLVYPYEYEEILTDDELLFRQLQASGILPDGKNLRLYDREQSAALSLTQLYGLQSKMDAALGRRVWLKSGSYLVIDPTEALTVIDVNSGKYEVKRDVEETCYHVNREAAAEIALQLRLRNLSGIIVVDFINMKEKKHQEELLAYLKELVKSDKQKTNVVDITPLGLVEITRKKSSKMLAEQLRLES